MTVYLGTFGLVELKREFKDNALFSVVNADDVNVTRKRFSFDFEHGQLLTGDQVDIKSTDGSALSFISGYTKTAVKKFINVDELDGIRFYNSFADAVNGGTVNAVALATPSGNIPIEVTVENTDARILASVQSYELNTQRESIDTTSLSDQFRSQISALMSGSGRMACEWDYVSDGTKDIPHYLLQLLLRTKIGSQFRAKFYIKQENYNPSGVAAQANDQLWYEFDGVLTACAMNFAPSSLVQFTADFITTGPIELQTSLAPTDNLLQENDDEILLDQDATARLLLESSDI
jgi:hypothetical protein